MQPEISLTRDVNERQSKPLPGRSLSLGEGLELELKLLVPIVVVLTFIGVVNALQAFYVFYSGAHTSGKFARFLISNLFYSWYFVIPALAVEWLSSRLSLRKETAPVWIAVHISTLIVLTVAHQTASLEVDRLVLGSRQAETVFKVLFNNPGVWGDFVVYILLLLGFYMLEYRKRNQENEIEYSQLEMELVESRFRELRSKIHPEFLFNTLNETGRLVRENKNAEADGVLSLLSEFLRATVYDNTREFCSVDEEVTFLRNYLAIEERRSAGNLHTVIETDDDARDALVPNFMLQPIIEELISRNLDNSPGPCEIQVKVRKDADQIRLSARIYKAATLPPGDKERLYDEILMITRQRISRLYPGGKNLVLTIDPDGWYVLEIVLPHMIATDDKIQKQRSFS